MTGNIFLEKSEDNDSTTTTQCVQCHKIALASIQIKWK